MSLSRTMARQQRLRERKAQRKAGKDPFSSMGQPLPREKLVLSDDEAFSYINPVPRPGNEGYNGYTDAPKADKGLRDGSCNRTACQKPLIDEPMRWSMGKYGHASDEWRLYYCGACKRDFSHWDRIDSPGQPERCSIYPGDEK